MAMTQEQRQCATKTQHKNAERRAIKQAEDARRKKILRNTLLELMQSEIPAIEKAEIVRLYVRLQHCYH